MISLWESGNLVSVSNLNHLNKLSTELGKVISISGNDGAEVD